MAIVEGRYFRGISLGQLIFYFDNSIFDNFSKPAFETRGSTYALKWMNILSYFSIKGLTASGHLNLPHSYRIVHAQ